MRYSRLFLLFLLAITSLLSGCNDKSTDVASVVIEPVPFTSVKVTDDFWAPRIKINHEVTIPIAIEQSIITGRIKNFAIAGGMESGEFCSQYPFDDSDVFKIIEGASYSLQTFPDEALEAKIDSLIELISLAQEEDGYLYTYRTIMGDDSHPWIGKRWEKTHQGSHELYNLGHMYEAAVAHFQATGKRSLLDVAIKSANLVAGEFGWGRRESYPGHQEIEIGLTKLYRITKDQKYLELAKFFLDVRNDGERYSQSHKRVVEQDSAVGHSVRAAYMYTGMADVAALTNDSDYLQAIGSIWEDIVYRKLYITGGIGASGGNEGFAGPYHLPNETAYCETCASIANVFWNHRMFLHKGQSIYYDVLERTLYNALLSGVSLSGDRFFYPNPLQSSGQHSRQEWFGCACCPSNICRFIPSVPGYIYGKTKEGIYVNLYIDSEANMEWGNRNVRIVQRTDYPWDGKIFLEIELPKPSNFELRLRIPGWSRNMAVPGDLYSFVNENNEKPTILVNGSEAEGEIVEGYVVINRKWRTGDRVELILPMPVRMIKAHEAVEENHDRIVIQRGPIVFCAEGIDRDDGRVLNLMIHPDEAARSEFRGDLLNGIQVVSVRANRVVILTGNEAIPDDPMELMLVPYHVWANRGPNEMITWLPTTPEEIIKP